MAMNGSKIEKVIEITKQVVEQEQNFYMKLAEWFLADDICKEVDFYLEFFDKIKLEAAARK